MITITDVLIAEHRVFSNVFDQIESYLTGLTTLAEVKWLATLVEGLLQSHAEAENNLAYAVLDHLLEEKGRIDRLHHDHQEIDASLRRAQAAVGFEEARRLLKTAIAASREHFLDEEQNVFPLIERVLQPDTLAALGTARVQPRIALAPGDNPRPRRSTRRSSAR